MIDSSPLEAPVPPVEEMCTRSTGGDNPILSTRYRHQLLRLLSSTEYSSLMVALFSLSSATLRQACMTVV